MVLVTVVVLVVEVVTVVVLAVGVVAVVAEVAPVVAVSYLRSAIIVNIRFGLRSRIRTLSVSLHRPRRLFGSFNL